MDDATAPGTLLGIYSEIDLSDRESVLAPGESVVFYTDGVTEERREGEQFGEDRLRELLAAAPGFSGDGIAERIERAVLEFQPVAPADDVAVVVLRITDAGVMIRHDSRGYLRGDGHGLGTG